MSAPPFSPSNANDDAFVRAADTTDGTFYVLLFLVSLTSSSLWNLNASFSSSSPVMNTNEIPIKLPERYASRRRQTRVIREDDINDELILERRREEYTSFFLSFVYEFRSVQRTAGKQNRTRNKCLRRLCCVYFSLSFGLFRCEETERRRLRRSFSLVVPRLRRSRNVSFVLTTRFYSNT